MFDISQVSQKYSAINIHQIENETLGNQKNKRKKKNQPDQPLELNCFQIEELWSDFIPLFCESKSVQDKIQDEYLAIADAFICVKQLKDHANEKSENLKKFTRPHLSINLLIKKLIAFIISVSNDRNSKKTIISLLSILRKILEKA